MEKLLHVFNDLGWQDVVDIGLNSYILFRFYVLFRGTYVFRVLIGLTMLWFFQQIAAYLGLIVTSWVVQGIVAVAALIIVVVFRNEIRTVLQAKNLKSILWGFTAKTRVAPVDVIADSAFELARRKHGGLIVIPGEEDLEELVQGGIAWNGDISREMILSIFFPDNPVHDGAAVIEGDRIPRVGAILPLSRRDDLPSYLGTRHRAALGLTEASDAVVVVVSEQRGEVSLARGSRLRPIGSRRKLVQKLEEHFGLAEFQAPEQRKRNVEIATAALVSLLFITGFWFSISRGLETLVTFEVPIEYMNRDPNMEIVHASVNSVRLNMSGSGTLIKSMRPDQVRVRLDIGNAAAGPNQLQHHQQQHQHAARHPPEGGRTAERRGEPRCDREERAAGAGGLGGQAPGERPSGGGGCRTGAGGSRRRQGHPGDDYHHLHGEGPLGQAQGRRRHHRGRARHPAGLPQADFGLERQGHHQVHHPPAGVAAKRFARLICSSLLPEGAADRGHRSPL